ncbi:hypothetical protein [uncultured Pseudokineococcus sp.]|uniref:hypothetical protein n=1 Tax=uncultured Pseudokineococcus sp. TaxID=1642928 RepID=UPI00262B037D|nr:hypothetical protein [uncultured Pseudokineococcus sp.]
MPAPTHLVTVDCFDTAITRALGEPRQVGYVVADRLRRAGLVTTSAEQYVEARERAEHLARRRVGPGRTLDDVARELVTLLALDPASAPGLVEAEVDVEVLLTREVPGTAARLARERDLGAQVGFLSDTPLTTDQLRRLLARAGVLDERDLVWTSSDLAAEKGEGAAYAAVVADLGGRPGTWRHSGDNHRSDVVMARLSGVRASWTPDGSLTRYERALDRASPATGGVSSLLAGSSRRARLLLAASDADADLAPAATGALGAVVVAYGLWALARADAAGAAAVRVEGSSGAAVALREVLVRLSGATTGVVVLGAGAPGAEEAVVVHAPDADGSGPGLHLVRRAPSGATAEPPAPAVGAGPRDAGWLRDDVAGTGAEEDDVEAVRLAVSLAAAGTRGPALVADELAPLVGLLPPGARSGGDDVRGGELVRADLRGAVVAACRRLRDDPSADDAAAWARRLPAVVACWPAAARAGAPTWARPAHDLRRRADAVAAVGRRVAARATVLARGRLGRLGGRLAV